MLTLAVADETTTALAARWEAEVALRLSDPEPDSGHRMVVALGRADIAAGISLARSRLNLANILDVAEGRRISCFVVGPPPGLHGDPRPAGGAVRGVRRRGRPPPGPVRGDLRPARPRTTSGSPTSRRATVSTPGQAGYGLMAWLVLHTGWNRWLGLPDDVL